jgi:hypothetical protein
VHQLLNALVAGLGVLRVNGEDEGKKRQQFEFAGCG